MKKGLKVTLLCSGKYWCPELEYNGKEVSIKDDYGNTVRMSSEQWNLLIEKVQKREIGKIEGK